MAKNQDRGLDAIIRGTEELIRDIPDPATLTQSQFLPTTELERHAHEEAARTFSSLIEPTADGMAEISIAKDEMTVHATFFPPGGEGKPLELDAVMSLIQEKGVTTGIDLDAIKGCILTCNEERTRVSDAVIARGRRPVNEVPPYLVVSERLLPKEKAADFSSARIDFRELSPFILVKKGEVLATLTPKQNGAMGTNVRGTAVAFHKEAAPSPKPGKNTLWQEGSLVAACDGRFQGTIASLWVEEVLDVKGDVDYHFGNIDFPGDVVIQGEVKDGFVVKAGKSLLCNRSIEACQVECGGDLVTQQGIIGKEKARLRVGGTTQAKFIEGCSLDSAGSIFVRTSVLNSSIRTRDRLVLGDRGIIIGGRIEAQNGVSAAQIGTERGPRTEIHCGVDFKVEQRLIWIRDKNIALAFKLREIENKMKANPSTRSVLAPLRERIKVAIHQLNENARLLVTNLDRNDDAAVSISETVYPGTYIEICHVSYFVTKPRRAVTYRLDKPSGKIVEARWDPRTKKAPAKS
jgi:uncharacterized protein (DUF342 family)